MSTTKKKINLFESEEGVKIREALVLMASDGTYNTKSSYSSDGIVYPDNLIPFVAKHMKYLNEHQNIEPKHYLANLRLMTRKR